MTYKSSTYALLGVLLGIFLTSTMQFVIAWTGPTQPAPNGNVGAPLTTSAVDQVKSGGVGVKNLIVTDNFKLNFGAGEGKVLVSDASGVASWQTSPTSQLSGAKPSGALLYKCPAIAKCWGSGCSSGCLGQVSIDATCSTKAADNNNFGTIGASTSHNCVPMGDILVKTVDFKNFTTDCGPVKAPSNSGSCSPYGDTALGYCVRAGYTSVSSKVIAHTAGDIINGMGMNADGSNYATTWGGGNSMVSVICGR